MTEVPRPRLTVFQAHRVLHTHELEPGQELTAGRMPQCDIVIEHHTVSRMHARFVHTDQGVFVEDLGSANGTFLEGRRIMGRQKLEDGQVIQLGQRTAAAPILIRFEDPAARLLKEMGLFQTPAPQPAPDAAAAPPGPTPELPEQPAAAARTEEPAAEAAVPAAAGDRTGLASFAQTLRDWLRAPHILGTLLLGLVLLALGTVWLVRTLRPTPPVWRSVQIRPMQVHAGSELTIESPDIRVASRVDIRLADTPIQDFTQEPGRIRIRVPELRPGATGPRDIRLVVYQRGIPVVDATVTYLVLPRIRRVVPTTAHVGESIEVHGTGFPADPALVRVRIGNRLAPVLASSPQTLSVRVPAVTQREPVQVPLRIQVGDWTAEAPVLLEIHPRVIQPLQFRFSAQFEPRRGAWEIRQPLGVVTYLYTPPAGSDELPPEVKTVLGALESALDLLTQDPDARFTVVTRGRRYQLVVQGSTRGQYRVALSWTRNELARLVRDQGLTVAPEMMPYWMASVWNDLVRVFVRGEALEDYPGAPAYVKVLNKLVRINRQAGGNGRPDLQDVALLSDPERAVLAHALLQVAPRFGNLAGVWIAELENIFYPDQAYRVRLTLDLRQDRTRLRGTAVIRFESPGLKWNPPEKPVTGRVVLGNPIEAHFRIRFDRPVGPLTFRGRVYGSRMQGTFRSTQRRLSGTWTGVLQEATQEVPPAPPYRF